MTLFSRGQRDQNQGGPNGSMQKPGTADAASVVAAEWSKDHSGQPGFRQGAGVAPGKEQRVLEVSSFLQVPAVLKALENGESLRLKFPQPAAGTPDADKIREEQKAIRAFITAKASMKFSDIQSELAQKVEGCLEFSQVSSGKFGGQDWVKAHGLDPKADSLTLTVTSVFKGDPVVSGGKVEFDSLMTKLEGHIATKDSAKAILTVEPTNAEALAIAMRDHLATRADKAKGLANVTVWVGTSNDPFTGANVSKDDCKSIVSMPLDDFLAKYAKSKKGTSATDQVGPEKKDQPQKDDGAVVNQTRRPKPVSLDYTAVAA